MFKSLTIPAKLTISLVFLLNHKRFNNWPVLNYMSYFEHALITILQSVTKHLCSSFLPQLQKFVATSEGPLLAYGY